MQNKPISPKNCSEHLWFAFLLSFLLCFILVCFGYSSSFYGPNNGFTSLFNKMQANSSMIIENDTDLGVKESDTDSCSGRYVYVHELPRRFNYDLVENCKLLTRGTTDEPNMCPYMENKGLGPEIEDSEGIFTNKRWYSTNQFLLEVIFHNRMKNYNCLTKNSSLASAIFVPFYAGLDVSRFLWYSNLTVRDASGKDLVQWLSSQPEWRKMWGRDHFLVSGRISWDFRRQYDSESYWGSKLRFLPESMNMSLLAVEASSWNNDYAIPYPTSFHPSNDNEISQWQIKIRHQKREYLFSFSGAPRPEIENSIRGKIIEECRASKSGKFMDCSYGKEKCDNPINVMKVFERSVFCLQPAGDSYTRRSIFDSMLAGCIPVFFHPGTAYSQYLWYLPKNRTKYSVYIPVKDVKEWNVNLEEVLLGIPEDEVYAIREEVIKLIPRIIYGDPRSKLDSFEDAFDVAMKGMLERIDRVREVIRNGTDPSIGFADADDYKYTFSHN